MATGDVTLTVVGVYDKATIAAGGTGQNVGALQISGSRLIYLPIENGQVMICKEVITGW